MQLNYHLSCIWVLTTLMLLNADGKILKSNKITNLGENSNKLNGKDKLRQKRELPDESEIQLYLEKHNDLRRLENAANMQIITWNNELAEMALLWAENCTWEHGQLEYENQPYDPVGQNLFASTSSNLDIESAIQAWYNEIQYYDFDSATCEESRVCGHYTQVVWDESKEMGCAATVCDTLEGTGFTNGVYLVCNYGPAGNWPRAPYTRGYNCTKCSTEVYWCDDGLCRENCDSAQCECAAACHNCGVANCDTCTCDCAPGYLGPGCTEECVDGHNNCRTGWPPMWCTDQYPYVLNNCPAMCGLCETADETDESCSGDVVDYCGNNTYTWNDGDNTNNGNDGDNTGDASDDDDNDHVDEDDAATNQTETERNGAFTQSSDFRTITLTYMIVIATCVAQVM